MAESRPEKNFLTNWECSRRERKNDQKDNAGALSVVSNVSAYTFMSPYITLVWIEPTCTVRMVIVVPLLPCGVGLHDYTVYIADQEQNLECKVKRRISLISVRLLHRCWFSSSRTHEQNVMHKSNNFLFVHEIFVLEVCMKVIFKTWTKIYF